jgi:putative membrane protein
VRIDTSAIAQAQNYGAGLAPFFAALAAWIGIYALFLIVKPVSRRALTAMEAPVRVTIAGWLTPALLGAVQMLGLFGVLSLALGFRFANPLAVLGLLVLASASYTWILLALNVWWGAVGEFIGLVLMVLQLVTAGGTFPWQTLPAPLAALHHVLPMGYVVDAMRQLMYGGDLGRALWDLGVLALWLAGALLVAAIGVTRMTHRRTLRDLQPSLIG